MKDKKNLSGFNMERFDRFSIIFLPEFLTPSLKELGITMSDIIDSIKEHDTIKSIDYSKDETPYTVLMEKLKKFLGKGDLTELSGLNNYLHHDVLEIDLYQNKFYRFFAEILWGNGSYDNEKNSISLIFKTLTDNNPKTFKDTYSIENVNGVVTVILKNGFTNHIVGSSSLKVKYELLKDIIDSVNSATVVHNSLGVSFAKIAGSALRSN